MEVVGPIHDLAIDAAERNEHLLVTRRYQQRLDVIRVICKETEGSEQGHGKGGCTNLFQHQQNHELLGAVCHHILALMAIKEDHLLVGLIAEAKRVEPTARSALSDRLELPTGRLENYHEQRVVDILEEPRDVEWRRRVLTCHWLLT